MDIRDFHPASPVPADAMYPDLPPFTAFGQYGEGKLDIRVFDQDVWWVDTHGKEHLLTEMSQEYLSNVLAFVYSGMEYHHMGTVWSTTVDLLYNTLTSNEANLELLDSLGKLEDIRKTPAEWLKDTPLVNKLEELIED